MNEPISLLYIEALHNLKAHVTTPEYKKDVEAGIALSIWDCTVVVAILFNKNKEEVMNDYLVISN